MAALPEPVRGGSVSELRAFVNVADDGDWHLLLGWLVGALRPAGPYPVLGLHGEQGSAKTTTARVLGELVDPSTVPVRAAPRDERDLMIAATNRWLVNLDNLSRIPPWLSDAICRLATGGGFTTRELYTDEDEVLFDAMRPVIINGIEELATRSDLLDRAILLTLPTIEPDRRRPEKEYWDAFDRARPRILGALLDALAVPCATSTRPTSPNCRGWPTSRCGRRPPTGAGHPAWIVHRRLHRQPGPSTSSLSPLRPSGKRSSRWLATDSRAPPASCSNG